MSAKLLRWVLTAPCAVTPGTLAEWWAERVKAAGTWDAPVDAAIARALGADRLGYAFSAGYHAALRALVPALPDTKLVAFCATEEGGAHPRAIRTRLEDGILSGHKRWSTLATQAAELLVVASLGPGTDGRNRLRVVRVSARAPGVAIRAMPETPFAPEIPHAELTLDAVRIAPDDVLPGDGYTDYLRPFRTIEDIHVHAALIAYLIAVARRSAWPRPALARLVAALVTARSLALEPPSDPALHIALSGLIDTTAMLVSELAALWQSVDTAERERWQRDSALLGVAARAREARRERAWQRIAELAR